MAFKVKIPATIVVTINTRTYEEAYAIAGEMRSNIDGEVALPTNGEFDDRTDGNCHMGSLLPNHTDDIWVGGEDD